MAKRELTAEERERLKANLAKGRVTAAANRAKSRDIDKPAARAVEPEPEPGEPETAEEYAKKQPGVSVALDDTRTGPVSLELSGDELTRTRAEAKKLVDAELAEVAKAERKKMMAKALDDEILRQRTEAGLIDYRDDRVRFMVNVAPFSDGIVIDGRTHQHGEWVTVSRREYDSVRDTMARSWESEDRAGNPNSRKFQQERQMAGVLNPMFMERQTEDGSFTVGPAGGLNVRAAGG